jgi:hypothetical protein
MKTSEGQAPILPAESSDLDALQSAISDGIQALVTWNISAFESATERQRVICDRLTGKPELLQIPGTAESARKVQELNRVYDKLLQHSIHWTRTIHSIFEANGHSLQGRASVHFRG